MKGWESLEGRKGQHGRSGVWGEQQELAGLGREASRGAASRAVHGVDGEQTAEEWGGGGRGQFKKWEQPQ